MLQAYSGFLRLKMGSKTVGEAIRPESLAVFKVNDNAVACAVMKERQHGR